MEQKELHRLLQQVADGSLTVNQAMTQFKTEPFQDLGFAKIDHHRALRQGAAEVIYGAGKTPEQILRIARAMLDHGQKTVLITRMSQEAAALLEPAVPLTYDPLSRVGIVGEKPDPDSTTWAWPVCTGCWPMPRTCPRPGWW